MALLKSPPKNSGLALQRGMALPTVLAILVAMIALAALLIQRNRMGLHPLIHARDQVQAHYLAEAGIAWGLYEARYGHPQEEIGEPTDSTLKLPEAVKRTPSLESVFSADSQATLQFRTDSSLTLPEMEVDEEGPYLKIHSMGTFQDQKVAITAQFGRALDPLLFGGALTWENETPVQPFSRSQIQGDVYLKTPTPGVPSLPWQPGINVAQYANSFAEKLFRTYESDLVAALAKEKGESGNGYFEKRHLPDFQKTSGELRFPIGHVEITGGAFDTLVIQGPGSIYSHGDIRVRGKVKLVNVTLASEAMVIFEGEVTGHEVRAYGRTGLTLMGKSQLEIQGLSGRDIHLRDNAQAVGHSMLMVMADKGGSKKGDTLQAIRIVNQAKAQGFLFAIGKGSRVVMGGTANLVQGIILAEEAWLAGTIEGSVAVRTLKCSEKGLPNCLGNVVIQRHALPTTFLQPMQLGPQNAANLQFKLLSYQVESNTEAQTHSQVQSNSEVWE